MRCISLASNSLSLYTVARPSSLIMSQCHTCHHSSCHSVTPYNRRHGCTVEVQNKSKQYCSNVPPPHTHTPHSVATPIQHFYIYVCMYTQRLCTASIVKR